MCKKGTLNPERPRKRHTCDNGPGPYRKYGGTAILALCQKVENGQKLSFSKKTPQKGKFIGGKGTFSVSNFAWLLLKRG